MVSLGRDGLYVIFRHGTAERDPVGFVIKPKSRRVYSEIYTPRGVCVGPLYFRTYRRPERGG